jgi:ADP-ribose pyrophosphatase YjhB (NUDIX family)
MREVEEETGVIAEAVGPLTVIDTIDRDTEGCVCYHYTLIAVIGTGQAGEGVPGACWPPPPCCPLSISHWRAGKDLGYAGDSSLRPTFDHAATDMNEPMLWHTKLRLTACFEHQILR